MKPERIDVLCPECGTRVTGKVDGEGGYGDDGQGVRWWIEERTGCDCLDDGEIMEYAESPKGQED